MKRRSVFWRAYLIFVAVLAALVLAATLYVRSVLKDYEASQPERYVKDAAAQLSAQAADGSLWTQYPLSDAAPSRFEEGRDLRAAYQALISAGELDCVKQSARRTDDHLVYDVVSDGFVLAEVELRPEGAPVTKLGILNTQKWAVEEARPVLLARDYALTVPDGYTVQVNGVLLSPEEGTSDGAGGTSYALSGLRTKPEVEISDPSGAKTGCTFKGDKAVPDLYRYSLTLPAAIQVTVDGAVHPGQPLEGGLVRHDIAQIAKPEVTVSDRYGNSLTYDGEDGLPLTYATITAASGYTVQIGGQSVQPSSSSIPSDYEHFAQYVPDLPQISVYDAAILQDQAEIGVTDPQGAPVELEPGLHSYDLTALTGRLDAVPPEVAAQVDVLDVAQKWSLFMSTDVRFSQLAPYLIRGSYQYEVADRYAHSIDITFTSPHSLLSPPFTDISVTNFTWISEHCFSVDISFVKHMKLTRGGMLVDDPMNDRFYFVWYDDTDDRVDNAAWKLAGIKEIVDDAGT